jgi:hypothetical protein
VSDATLSSSTSRFVADYRPVSPGAPELGSVAVLPWDADVFGFRVADYAAPDAHALVGETATDRLARDIAAWAEREDVHLVGTRVPTTPSALGALLEHAGFRFVEIQLRATLPRLRGSELRAPRLTVRAAEPADYERIAEIAESAFTLGRYHADPRFPRALADRRYRVWIERALAEPSSSAWIAAVGPPGKPNGFLQTEIAGNDAAARADIRLAAVDRESAGIAGPELFVGALHELARRGVSAVTARISAVNTSVWNIYASLGFRFHEPELVFHWHRPGSTRLVSLRDSLAAGPEER